MYLRHGLSGGYQLVGRTLPIWNKFKKNKQFGDKEWFLNFFDQIKYFPVSESELEQWRADFENGQAQIQIEDTEFDYAAYLQLLEDEKDSIAEFRAQQQHAFSAEVGLWKESVDHQEHLIAEIPDETDYSAYAALHASMTGNIWKILVEQGQIVKKGETIAIIEAMKMELPCTLRMMVLSKPLFVGLDRPFIAVNLWFIWNSTCPI